MIALDYVAVVSGQGTDRRSGFHAFGNYTQTEVVAEFDNTANNERSVSIGVQVEDKRLVDLKRTDGEILELPQAGVTRTEVIDGDLNTHLTELLQETNGLLGLEHDG